MSELIVLFSFFCNSGSVEEESSDGSFTSGDDEEDPAMDAEEMVFVFGPCFYW